MNVKKRLQKILDYVRELEAENMSLVSKVAELEKPKLMVGGDTFGVWSGSYQNIDHDQYGYNTPDQQYLLHTINEIERLQKEIELLQTNRKLLNRDLEKAQQHIQKLKTIIVDIKTKPITTSILSELKIWDDIDDFYDDFDDHDQNEEEK